MKRTTVANILGALGQATADAIRDGVGASATHGPTESAALVHLSKYADETINELRVPLGLSHPGCVRLVDRLAAAKLLRRADAAHDGRAVRLALTARGTAAARRALRLREQVLLRALGGLSADERETLGRLAGKVLRQLVASEADALRVCRFCDYDACPDEECPVGRAVEAAAPQT